MLPSPQKHQLDQIISAIKSTNLAEVIILYGSFARGDFKLEQGEWSGGISDFDLFILTSGKKQRETERKIKEALPETEMVVEIVCEEIETFKQVVKENRFFYTDILKEGKILFHSGKIELPKIPESIDPKLRLEIAELDFEDKFSEITNRFAVAKFLISEQKYRSASFDIQQVFELSYKLIDLIFTQYVNQGHHLLPLREKAKKLDSRINTVFPLETQKSKSWFEHLDKAYIGARYHTTKNPEGVHRPTYDVSREQVDFWITEAEKLVEITKIICEEKIAILDYNR